MAQSIVCLTPKNCKLTIASSTTVADAPDGEDSSYMALQMRTLRFGLLCFKGVTSSMPDPRAKLEDLFLFVKNKRFPPLPPPN